MALANALVKEDQKSTPNQGGGAVTPPSRSAILREGLKRIISGPAGWGGAAGLASLPGILALALALRRRGGAKGANKLVSLLRKVRPR